MNRSIVVFSVGLSWCAACTGDKGDPGAMGMVGAQGPAGRAGDQGPNGDPGGNGTNGMDGRMGMNGMDGAPGTDGMNGMNGAPGPRGPQGRTVVLSEAAKVGLDIDPVQVDTSSSTDDELEMIGRGSYIVNAVGACDDCHQGVGASGFLAGGMRFDLSVPGTFVYARNLTTDSTGLDLSEDQFVTAMRTGEDFDNPGESLLVMPWQGFRWMTEDDLRSIYRYLELIPPVISTVPADNKGPLAMVAPTPFPAQYDEGEITRDLPPEDAPDPERVLRGLAIDPVALPVDFDSWSADTQAAFARGSYLVNALALCSNCHTNPSRDFTSPNYQINFQQYLTGGRVFTVPAPLNMNLGQTRTMSANLSGAMNGFEDNFPTFVALLSYGNLGFPMPREKYRLMTLDDQIGVYTFITRAASIAGANDKATQPPAVWCAANGDCAALGAGATCDVASAECVGYACVADAECGACQTCGGASGCLAPTATSTCLANGI